VSLPRAVRCFQGGSLLDCFHFIEMDFLVLELGNTPDLVCFSGVLSCGFENLVHHGLWDSRGNFLFLGARNWLLAFIIAEYRVYVVASLSVLVLLGCF
jgi:hypothetical protein